jgi:hypothetical protein
MGRWQRYLIVVASACALTGALPAAAPASQTQETDMQDDTWMIYSEPYRVLAAMDVMKSLGVDRIRVSVVWSLVAPNPADSHAPKFDATNPNAYPTGVWKRYDTVVSLARAVGLKLYFQLTAPAPTWATPPRGLPQGYRYSHDPSAKKFGQFAQAVGKRYHGLVSYWGIWNEPNIGGWMTPQWRTQKGHKVEASPAIYRGMVDAAWKGLKTAGDGRDTILLGETGAYGFPWKGYGADMSPLTFLRALYCVGTNNRPLIGRAARRLKCPASGRKKSFRAAHPALFKATGWAHHPYDFNHGPGVHLHDPGAADLADLGRLERTLDTVRGAYGAHRKWPLYLTEWGYQSNPPDPFIKYSLADQATYLNQGEYMAWRDPRVRTFSQFLLIDSAPFSQYPSGSHAYWSSFQTGLVGLDGSFKPSYDAFRLPIWLPHAHHGPSVEVWGQLRPADHTTPQRATLEFEAAGSGTWTPLSSVQTTNSEGFFDSHVAIPSSGHVRLSWPDPRTGGTDESREAPVS